MRRRAFGLIPAVLIGLAFFTGTSECRAQPAPALSQIQAEFSSSGSPAWDAVPVGGLSTNRDHRGPTLSVRVLETGYASSSSRIAKFNGSPMRLVRSTAQVNPYTRAVWGWLNEYRIDGNWTSGTFTYQASSLVFPYRTLSMRVYVR